MRAFERIPFASRGFSPPYRIALPRTQRIARRALFPVILCAGIAVPILSFELLGLRIGLTDSACPPGIYRMVSRAPSRGDLVLACLPNAIAQFGQARGYLLSGRGCGNGIEPVSKRLSALPGDVVEVMHDYVAVNGQRLEHSATHTHDSRGQSVQHVEWGRYTVPTNQVWLLGTKDARSWDSRYFGPVPASSVRAALDPVLTW
ncbi:MAG: conjugative transfer signal peptidase TraF [Candidatus Binataceae bacterium]